MKKEKNATMIAGNYLYYFIFECKTIKVTLNVTGSHLPQLISNSTILVQSGEDEVFVFRLYNASLGYITGNGITEDDYVIEDGILTIKSSFIQSKFDEDDSRTKLIISYTLIEGDELQASFVFIELQK